MMKKIFKLIAVAQAVAFPSISVQAQKAEATETTLKETNIVFNNSIVDSLYISNPKNTTDIFQVIKNQELIRLSPVTDLSKNIYFRCGAEPENPAYNGLAIIEYGPHSNFLDNVLSYVDASNLITYSLTGDNNNMCILFGDIKNVPYNKVNKNVIVKFKQPMKVNYIAPGLEKYVFNPKPVDQFALSYNGLLNGYAYNLLGGREDIDKTRFREYIKNHVSLQTEGFWKGEATFTIATFKNGTEEFEIVGWVADYPNSTNVSIATNYKAKSISGIKLLCGYIFNDSGEVISEATNSTNIDKYYTCTIVDETAAKYVLTGGPDFSYFLDYTKEIGFPYGYAKGYTDGQNNPTFKSFIVSAFEACSAFFALPVLGQNITIGTLIGSFVGLGALFLIIKLFR